jgi:hypothetical protein
MLSIINMEVFMSLAVQKGFWQDKVLADTRQKLAQLYFKNPQIAESEKRVILEFWQAYEGLDLVIRDKLQSFISWFSTATSPETITRCLRALKEDGTIIITPENAKRRQEQEQQWRHYWGNEARVRDTNG